MTKISIHLQTWAVWIQIQSPDKSSRLTIMPPPPPPPWLPLKKMHTTTLILVLRIAYMYMYLNGFSPGTIHCSPLLLPATFFQASLVLLCDRWYGADGLRTACRGSSTLEVMYRPISNPSKLNTNR